MNIIIFYFIAKLKFSFHVQFVRQGNDLDRWLELKVRQKDLRTIHNQSQSLSPE